MKLLSFLSFAFALSLASANTYALEPPQLPEQIEAAILLDEDGTPRCRIGQAPELEDLRECNEDDELYARMALNTEEISLGMATPLVNQIRTIVVVLSHITLGFLTTCAISHSVDTDAAKKGSPWELVKLMSILTGGLLASAGSTVIIFGANNTLAPIMVAFLGGTLTGISGCEETPHPTDEK